VTPAPSRPAVSGLLGPEAIIAVVDVDDAASAGELAAVLADSGIEALEITLRKPHALASLEGATARATELRVGAGTVLTREHATMAVDVGAEFLVSPGLHMATQSGIDELGIPILPGILTPSEAQTAIAHGFSEVKLFPVEQFGGISLVNTLAAVFPQLSFVPSGGLSQASAVSYFQHRSVSAIGGSWIAPAADIRAQNWNSIARRADSIVRARRSGNPS